MAVLSVAVPGPVLLPVSAVPTEGARLAELARGASSAGSTAEAATVMNELAHLLPEMKANELQYAAANTILQGLQRCEENARLCLNVIVSALAAPQAGQEVVLDALWALHKLTLKFNSAVEWVLHLRGGEHVLNAMRVYPDNKDLVLCGVWVLHSLHGMQGLATLLGADGGTYPLADPVMAAVIWIIYELRKQGAAHSCTSQDANHLLGLTVGQLRSRIHSTDVKEACCALLYDMIDEEPELARSFVELGAAPLLVQALALATAEQEHAAVNSTEDGESLIRNCAGIFSKLAHGSAQMKAAICHGSALHALEKLSFRGQGGIAEETAVMVLGQLCGLPTVIKAMQAQPVLPSVVRGGFDSIAELVGNDSLDESDVQQLPPLVHFLREMFVAMDSPSAIVKCRMKCTKAFCRSVEVLSSYAEPCRCEQLDRAVKQLLEALQHTDAQPEIQQRVVECVGRVALNCENWRLALRECKTTELLRAKIRMLQGQHRLMKYCFWCGAAIAGVHLVIGEMQANLHESSIVDAALCTIIDILDDDVEADWVLQHAERPTESEVPQVLHLISVSMRMYPRNKLLQRRACHCVALMIPLVHPNGESLHAMSMVFDALRFHPDYYGVLCDGLCACRSAWQTALRYGDAKFLEQVIGAFRKEGIAQMATGVSHEFCNDVENDTFEDAAVLVCAIEGVDVAMRNLSELRSPVARSGGIKGVFEFGKIQSDKLHLHAREVHDRITCMVSENPNDQRLRENAELLIGLCRCPP